MFTSIFRWRVEGSLEDLAGKAEKGLVPVLRQCPGFIAYYVVDTGDGHAATICVFESRETELASRDKAAAWAKDNASAYLPEPPEITAGETLIAVTR